jgi:hypothetical protein
MVWTCSTHGLGEKIECNGGRRNPRKESLGRPRHKWEDGVDVALK